MKAVTMFVTGGSAHIQAKSPNLTVVRLQAGQKAPDTTSAIKRLVQEGSEEDKALKGTKGIRAIPVRLHDTHPAR